MKRYHLQYEFSGLPHHCVGGIGARRTNDAILDDVAERRDGALLELCPSGRERTGGHTGGEEECAACRRGRRSGRHVARCNAHVVSGEVGSSPSC